MGRHLVSIIKSAYLQVVALLAAVQEAYVNAVRVVVGGRVSEGGEGVACLQIEQRQLRVGQI